MQAVERTIAKLQRRRLAYPTGHETIDRTDGPFLCEYPWRNTWRGDCTPYEDGNIGNIPDIKYIRPVAWHLWETSLDASLQNGASVHVPKPWMGKGYPEC